MPITRPTIAPSLPLSQVHTIDRATMKPKSASQAPPTAAAVRHRKVVLATVDDSGPAQRRRRPIHVLARCRQERRLTEFPQ